MTNIIPNNDEDIIELVPSVNAIYLLALLDAPPNKPITGRTRLVKMVFLLQEEIKKNHKEILQK